MFNSAWFYTLNRPPLSPPNWVFAPVWIFLYAAMFCSLAFYMVSKGANKGLGYLFFFIQLALNIAWSPIFFGAQNIKGALIIIILLDIALILTILQFLKTSKLAGLLLIPYLLWVFFATYLNIGYYILN